MVESGVYKMTFQNSLTHKYFVNFLFGEEIDGIKVFEPLLVKQDRSDLYDNWTFPDNTVMDKFYYDNNTKILLNTPDLPSEKRVSNKLILKRSFKR